MNKKINSIDTDKALKALQEFLTQQKEKIYTEIREKQAYLEGIEKGVEIFERILQSPLYERKE